MSFLGIGAGGRRRRAAAHSETEDEMRARHGRELDEAGFRRPPEEEACPRGDDDAPADEARSGDEMPPNERPDADAPPAERTSEEGDGEGADDGDNDGAGDDDAEDREDRDIDAEPDEELRRARRARTRRARRLKARRVERRRAARIFQHAAAAKNVGLAAELAFNTGLSSRRAIALLKRGGAGAGSLAARMATVAAPIAALGDTPPRGAPRNVLEASWDRAITSAWKF